MAARHSFPLILEIPDAFNCRIIRRLNRFVVEVVVGSRFHRACLNNTGRLGEFLVQGREGFCLKTPPQAKTDFRLFAIKESGLGAVIDTQFQMRAFESALKMGLIPYLEAFRMLKRNARLGTSLIDYLLKGHDGEAYLEVKSAVLRDGSYAMYPDCPSVRGRRHIRELTSYVRQGGKASILFVAGLPGVSAFKPNRAADPELGRLLTEGYETGLGVRAINLAYHPEDAAIHLYSPDLKVDLS